MKYFSMFSGIGGFELGIQRAVDNRGATSTPTLAEQRLLSDTNSSNGQRRWSNTSCVGYSEIDKYAIKVYERHFNDHTNYGDATAIVASELSDFELLVGGFPCQAFSIAGKRAGFNDTRGTLFFDIARILAEKRPRHLVLENVKGLLSHENGKTFQTILGVLTDLGYLVEWQVLNSKDFGVPQNRERVYIVGHLGNKCRGKVFPITRQSNPNTTLGKSTKASVARTLTGGGHSGGNHSGMTIIAKTVRSGGRNSPHGSKQARPAVIRQYGETRYSKLSPTLRTPSGGNRLPMTLEGAKIRRLTPIECERLQGFPDNWTAGESDTQRYKMCGNAVTVNTVEAVVKGLLNHV